MSWLAEGDCLTRERVRRFALVSAAAGAAMLLFLWLSRSGSVDHFGSPVGADFTAFWHAGRLANEGQPATAWNPELLNAAVHATHGSAYPTAWLYPPVFLLVAAPLAALPYLPALLAWQLFGLAALALTLRAILGTGRELLIALASPLTALALANGQNALLTAALLGWGLILLERRPAAAGCVLGCLLYKPQLALVIGPLLIATRNWRAFAAAAAAAFLIVVVSLLAWGFDSWTAFIGSLGLSRGYMEEGSVGYFKSASLFSAARQWGAPVQLSYAVQAAGALAALFLVWRAREADAAVRAAATCAAVALSTPYLLDYDLAVVGVGAAFLYAEARRTGFVTYERSALAFIWIAPWFSRPAAEHAALPLGAFTILLLYWLALRRVSARCAAGRASAVDTTPAGPELAPPSVARC